MIFRPETDAIVEFLNELVDLDRGFVTDLFAYRAHCNDAIADHASVQVGVTSCGTTAGVLGVINGFLGTIESGPHAGRGPITAIIENGNVTRFIRTARDGR